MTDKEMAQSALWAIDSAILDIKQKAEETSCEDIRESAQVDYDGLLMAKILLSEKL